MADEPKDQDTKGRTFDGENTVRGVSVNHPAIVDAIQNAHSRGYSQDRIVEMVGMPGEVVAKHIRDYEARKR